MKTNYFSTALRAGLLIVLSCGLTQNAKPMVQKTTVIAKAADIIEAAGLKDIAALDGYDKFVSEAKALTPAAQSALANAGNDKVKVAAFWRTFAFKALIKCAQDYLNPNEMVKTEAPAQDLMLTTILTKIGLLMPTGYTLKYANNTITITMPNAEGMSTTIALDLTNNDNDILNDTVVTIADTLRAIHNITYQILSGYDQEALREYLGFIITRLNLVTVNGTDMTIREYLNSEITNITAFIESSANLDLLNAAQGISNCYNADTSKLNAAIKVTRDQLKTTMNTQLGKATTQKRLLGALKFGAITADMQPAAVGNGQVLPPPVPGR